MHARHVLVAPLQTGLSMGHCALLVHSTHLPAAALQTGLAVPTQRVLLVAEHSSQRPSG
jgi:hypothetical protein